VIKDRVGNLFNKITRRDIKPDVKAISSNDNKNLENKLNSSVNKLKRVSQAEIHRLAKVQFFQNQQTRLSSAHIAAAISNKNEKVDLKNTDLSGLDLTKLDLSKQDLSGCNLKGADLSGCDLTETNFSGANLTDTKFIGVKLNNVKFKGARLNNTNFMKADMKYVDFEDAQLLNANLTDSKIENAYFRHSQVRDTSFQGAKLYRTFFTKAKLEDVNFKNSELSTVEFKNSDVNKTDFNDSELSSSKIISSKFSNASFKNTHMTFNKIKETEFQNCNLDNANLSLAELQKVKFNNIQAENLKLHKSTLEETSFENSQLANADLHESVFIKTLFDKTSLQNSIFSKSTLRTSNSFTNVDLKDSNFSEAALNGYVDNLDKKMPAEITTFKNSNLENANFEKSLINLATFDTSNLRQTNFNGAKFQKPAKFINIDKSLVAWSNKYKKVSKPELIKLLSSNHQLENLNLSGLDLSKVDFSNKTLKNVDLIACNLNGSNFEGTKLHHVELDLASLKNANLQNADFNDEKPEELFSGKSSSAREVDFSGSNLYRAKFNNTDLTYTKFNEANLKDVTFNSSSLINVELENASMNGSLLNNSNIISLKPEIENQIKFLKKNQIKTNNNNNHLMHAVNDVIHKYDNNKALLLELLFGLPKEAETIPSIIKLLTPREGKLNIKQPVIDNYAKEYPARNKLNHYHEVELEQSLDNKGEVIYEIKHQDPERLAGSDKRPSKTSVQVDFDFSLNEACDTLLTLNDKTVQIPDVTKPKDNVSKLTNFALRSTRLGQIILFQLYNPKTEFTYTNKNGEKFVSLNHIEKSTSKAKLDFQPLGKEYKIDKSSKQNKELSAYQAELERNLDLLRVNTNEYKAVLPKEYSSFF
jgi:uncharacterized protein YjbI with pentapeptide repeats